MILRDITEKDFDSLVVFWNENYFVSEMDNRAHFVLFLEKNPGLSVLAEMDGKVVGTALGSYDGRRGYLQKVVTSKELRKNGIGKKLVEEVIKRLKAIGALYIPISVKSELIPFYEECGFIKTESTSMSIDL